MTDEHVMPQYDGMEYEELVAAAQFLWMENAKLREQGARLFDKTLELGTENAKLRNLVKGLWFTARYSGMSPDGATGSGFARQMRELGIEAD